MTSAMRAVRASMLFACFASIAFAQTSAPPAPKTPTQLPADAIEGVQAASLDQPRIYVRLRRSANGPLLKVNEAGMEATAIEAFLDTGASGFVISSTTADALKITVAEGVKFADTGVAGSEEFGVSEPLFAQIAQYPQGEGEDDSYYRKVLRPMRTEIRTESGLMAMLSPGLDIAGMPLMAGMVMVMDPRPLAQMDKIRTLVVPPNDKSIPKTSRGVPLTYVSFDAFTTIKPAGSPGPQQSPSPMIGPDPFKPGDPRNSIVVTHRGKTASGTFLLDTGAATSMISRAMAEKLGVKTDEDGKLVGVPSEQQFSLTVGGLGGQKEAHGIKFDSLTLPASRGKPIVYAAAPLLVADISVVDANGKTFTLDGILGMNYLVASAEITGGLLPDIGKINDGPFKFIVIDHARKELGLEPQ